MIAHRRGTRLRVGRAFSEFKNHPKLQEQARENLGVGGIKLFDRTLTAAEIRGLFTNNILLLPPVEGKSHVVLPFPVFRYKFATAAFTGQGSISIRYHDSNAVVWLYGVSQLAANDTENLVGVMPAHNTAYLTDGTGLGLEIYSTHQISGGGGTLQVIFPYITA
jgi:hypothetical protein